ncbi:MAG: NfeD family protein [Oscillospiraceae bacterium]|nr:NfeD family protein [Oscillospiraceae bacterium]
MEAIIWLGLMVVFLIVEASTVTMVSLWFAAGSLAAMIAALLGGPIWLQVALCLAVSAVLLACLRPMVRRKFTPKLKSTNVDAIVGTRGYVTADIDNVAAAGQVKLNGMEWTARSEGGEKIPAGTLVRVERIEGVKVFVSPVESKVTT